MVWPLMCQAAALGRINLLSCGCLSHGRPTLIDVSDSFYRPCLHRSTSRRAAVAPCSSRTRWWARPSTTSFTARTLSPLVVLFWLLQGLPPFLVHHPMPFPWSPRRSPRRSYIVAAFSRCLPKCSDDLLILPRPLLIILVLLFDQLRSSLGRLGLSLGKIYPGILVPSWPFHFPIGCVHVPSYLFGLETCLATVWPNNMNWSRIQCSYALAPLVCHRGT